MSENDREREWGRSGEGGRCWALEQQSPEQSHLFLFLSVCIWPWWRVGTHFPRLLVPCRVVTVEVRTPGGRGLSVYLLIVMVKWSVKEWYLRLTNYPQGKYLKVKYRSVNKRENFNIPRHIPVFVFLWKHLPAINVGTESKGKIHCQKSPVKIRGRSTRMMYSILGAGCPLSEIGLAFHGTHVKGRRPCFVSSFCTSFRQYSAVVGRFLSLAPIVPVPSLETCVMGTVGPSAPPPVPNPLWRLFVSQSVCHERHSLQDTLIFLPSMT